MLFFSLVFFVLTVGIADAACSATTAEGALSMPSGSILSDADGSGVGTYATNNDCTWTFACPSGQVLKLDFTGTPELEASYDHLYFQTSAGVMLTSVSSLSAPDWSTFIALASGEGLETGKLKFTSDSVVVKKGFEITYTCVVPSCGATTTEGALPMPSGSILSDADGSGTGLYTMDNICVWTFSCPSGQTLSLGRIGNTDLEIGYDYLFVKTTGGTTVASVSAKVNGPWNTFENNAAAALLQDGMIKFTSDATFAERGFEVTYSCVVPSCSATTAAGALSMPSGSILSDADGSGAGEYSVSNQCVWTFSCGSGKTLQLTRVGSPKLESGYDYLYARNAEGDTVATISSTSTPAWDTFVSDVNALLLESGSMVFTSDASLGDNGFELTYLCVGGLTPTKTASATPPFTQTPTVSLTGSQSRTVTPAPTRTRSPSHTSSWSHSSSESSTISRTSSGSGSQTRTSSESRTASRTGSVSASLSKSVSGTSTPSKSNTRTSTVSRSGSKSPSATPVPTPTASATHTVSSSPTVSAVPTASRSGTASPSASVAPSATVTPSSTLTPSALPTATHSGSPTVTTSLSLSQVRGGTPSRSQSTSIDASSTPTPIAVRTPSSSASASAIPAAVRTGTPSTTGLPSVTNAASISAALTTTQNLIPPPPATAAPTTLPPPTSVPLTPVPTPAPPGVAHLESCTVAGGAIYAGDDVSVDFVGALLSLSDSVAIVLSNSSCNSTNAYFPVNSVTNGTAAQFVFTAEESVTYAVCYTMQQGINGAKTARCSTEIESRGAAPWNSEVALSTVANAIVTESGLTVADANVQFCKSLTPTVLLHPVEGSAIFGSIGSPYASNERCVLVIDPQFTGSATSSFTATAVTLSYALSRADATVAIFVPEGTANVTLVALSNSSCVAPMAGYQPAYVRGDDDTQKFEIRIPVVRTVVTFCTSSVPAGGKQVALSYELRKTRCPNDCRDSRGVTRGRCVGDWKVARCVCDSPWEGESCQIFAGCASGDDAPSIAATGASTGFLKHAAQSAVSQCGYQIKPDASGHSRRGPIGIGFQLLSGKLSSSNCSEQYVRFLGAADSTAPDEELRRLCKGDIEEMLKNGASLAWLARVPSTQQPLVGGVYVEISGKDAVQLSFTSVMLSCPGTVNNAGYVPEDAICGGRGRCLNISYDTSQDLLQSATKCVCSYPLAASSSGASCDTCAFGIDPAGFPTCARTFRCEYNCSFSGDCTLGGCDCNAKRFGHFCAYEDVEVQLRQRLVLRSPLDKGASGDAVQEGVIDSQIMTCELPGRACVPDQRGRGRAYGGLVGAQVSSRRQSSADGSSNAAGDFGVSINSITIPGTLGDFLIQDRITGKLGDHAGAFTLTGWVQLQGTSNGFLYVKTDDARTPEGRFPAVDAAMLEVRDRHSRPRVLDGDSLIVYAGVYVNGARKQIDVMFSQRDSTGGVEIAVRHFRLDGDEFGLFDGSWRFLAIAFDVETMRGRVYVDGATRPISPGYMQCFPFFPGKVSTAPDANTTSRYAPELASVRPEGAVLIGYGLQGSLDEVRVYDGAVAQVTIIDIGGDELLGALQEDRDALLAMTCVGALVCVGVATFRLVGVLRSSKQDDGAAEDQVEEELMDTDVWLEDHTMPAATVDEDAELEAKGIECYERAIAFAKTGSSSSAAKYEETALDVEPMEEDTTGSEVLPMPEMLVQNVSDTDEDASPKTARPDLSGSRCESSVGMNLSFSRGNQSVASLGGVELNTSMLNSRTSWVSPGQIELNGSQSFSPASPGCQSARSARSPAPSFHLPSPGAPLADDAPWVVEEDFVEEPLPQSLPGVESFRVSETSTTGGMNQSYTSSWNLNRSHGSRSPAAVSFCDDKESSGGVSPQTGSFYKASKPVGRTASGSGFPRARSCSIEEDTGPLAVGDASCEPQAEREASLQTPAAESPDPPQMHRRRTLSYSKTSRAEGADPSTQDPTAAMATRSNGIGASFSDAGSDCEEIVPGLEESRRTAVPRTASSAFLAPLSPRKVTVRKHPRPVPNAPATWEVFLDANISTPEESKRRLYDWVVPGLEESSNAENVEQLRGAIDAFIDTHHGCAGGSPRESWRESFEVEMLELELIHASCSRPCEKDGQRNCRLLQLVASILSVTSSEALKEPLVQRTEAKYVKNKEQQIPVDDEDRPPLAVEPSKKKAGCFQRLRHSLSTSMRDLTQRAALLRDFWQILALLIGAMTFPSNTSDSYGSFASVAALAFDSQLGVHFMIPFAICCSISMLAFLALTVVVIAELSSKLGPERMRQELCDQLTRQANRLEDGKAPSRTRTGKERVAQITLLVLTTMYLPTTRVVLIGVFCHEDVLCLYDCYVDPEHKMIVWIGIVVGICVTVISPLMLSIATMRRQREFRIFVGKGDDTTADELWEQFLVVDVSPFTSLYGSYRRKWGQFSCVMLLVKAGYVLITLLTAADTTAQVVSATITLSLMTLGSAVAEPFRFKMCNFLLVALQAVILLVLSLHIVHRLNPDELGQPVGTTQVALLTIALAAHIPALLLMRGSKRV